MEMSYIKIQEHSISEFGDSRKHNFEATWEPGFMHQVPWAGILALIVALLSWTVQPTVLLALLTAAVNSLLHFALSEGLTVVWWRKALAEDTIVSDLHHHWSFGTSIIAATLAGRRFNCVSLASIITTLLVIDAPLLQRASSITSQNVTIPITMSANIATISPTTGIITGRIHYASVLDPLFARVMQDYGNRVPINSFTGCYGTCSLKVKAFGFTTHCATETSPINHTISTLSTENPDHPLFWTEHDLKNGGILLNSSYASFHGAPNSGIMISSVCILRPATLEYPLVSHNGTLQLQTSTSNYTVISMSNVPDEMTGRTVLGGIQLAADNTFRSSATTRWAGAVEWDFVSEGSLATRYINESDAHHVSFTSEISFRDPIPDILASFNDIMFRFALAAANSSTKQTVPAVQKSEQNIYQSHYRYLAGALMISLFSIVTVTPMFYGYWQIGRRVSMSPIETSKAFDAPLLKGCGSNAEVEKLLHDVGKRRVRYGEVIFSDYLQPVMGESTVEGHSLHRRLAMMSPDQIVHPRRKVKYD
ncbi:MAG: hypothetical protein M1812_003446 [Candelaria pacifica]|nr:MAG: hypothetical protein M1812_003446 [Candelaria pacifica]